MKGSRIFIICILLFLVIMFLVEYNLPKDFIWKPTFSQYDKQPFGCAVFDDVVSASYQDGYSISTQSFYQLREDSVQQLRSYLLIEEKLGLAEIDVHSILDLAHQGNRIMLVSTSFGKTFRDTLGVSSSYGYFNANTFKKYVASFADRDTLMWVGDSVYDTRYYTFYPQICNTHFMNKDSLAVVLASSKELDGVAYQILDGDTIGKPVYIQSPVAYRRNIGKGMIVFVSTPLVFTNYGMLDTHNSEYIFRILNELKGLPMVRLESYGIAYKDQQTPLRYFLSQPPLQWGLYLAVITILLFMFFTARRKQRIIPVVRDPENKTVEFTELIGTLYFQRKDHTDLLQKKFTYFAEALRRNIQVDIEDDTNDEELARRISKKTGMEAEKIMLTFRRVRPVMEGKETINELQLKLYIDSINEILNHL